MESLYSRRLARVRENMTRWGADLLVLNFGPDFIYLTGMEGPLYYTTLKGYGDWVTSVIVSQDHDPVIVLHPWFNVDVHTWVSDVRVMPANEQNPDAFLANILNEFAPAGRTVAIGKMAWASTLLSLQEAAPTAIFIQATNAMMDEMRSIKDPEEIEILQKASEITDISLAETIKRMKPGMTERDVQIEVEYQIRLRAAMGLRFLAASSPSAMAAIRTGTSLPATPISSLSRACRSPSISACSIKGTAPISAVPFLSASQIPRR